VSMISDRPPEDQEQLSPELVLVSDEETMRRARERLPEHPWLVVRNGAVDVPLPPRLVFEEAAETPPPPPPRRRRRGRLGAAVVLVLAVGLAGYLTETRWRDASATTADVTSTAPTGAATTAPAPTRTAGAVQTETAPTLAPPTSTAGSAPAPHATTAAAKPTTKPESSTTRTQRQATSPPPRPSGFVPARVWTWAPAKGAQTYEVTFYLDGRVVLRERVKESRLAMPSSFRFEAGRYRWTVRAIPAASPTARIVDSSFVLTPATAAAANASSNG